MLSGPSRRAICSTFSSLRSGSQSYGTPSLSIRTFSSSTIRLNPEEQNQQIRQASTSTSSGKKAQDASVSISSCAPGTSLSGLNIYKDRADPVALPDDQYPEWLWKILDDQKKTSSGVVLESTEGMTKGEARAAEKRNLRAIRAAAKAKERVLAKQAQMAKQASSDTSGAGMNATGQASQGVEETKGGNAESLAADAAIAVMDPEVSFKQAKKQLRKANRANIKASNFVKSQ